MSNWAEPVDYIFVLIQTLITTNNTVIEDRLLIEC